MDEQNHPGLGVQLGLAWERSALGKVIYVTEMGRSWKHSSSIRDDDSRRQREQGARSFAYVSSVMKGQEKYENMLNTALLPLTYSLLKFQSWSKKDTLLSMT